MTSPVAGSETVPASDDERLHVGLSRAVDRALSLPARRRAFLALQADTLGPELSAGYRLWDSDWSQGALAAWAGSEWGELREWTLGARLEARF